RGHAHAFAKEECRKNATQKRRANVLCTFFIYSNVTVKNSIQITILQQEPQPVHSEHLQTWRALARYLFLTDYVQYSFLCI
ncbi:MAG: hypothetical protein IIV45_01065, partial [Lachnospiraceae bacterium]|nr:hypothetical protein [Lachnospiraceae bacterium]